jgi:hypothetical protein
MAYIGGQKINISEEIRAGMPTLLYVHDPEPTDCARVTLYVEPSVAQGFNRSNVSKYRGVEFEGTEPARRPHYLNILGTFSTYMKSRTRQVMMREYCIQA